MLTNTTLETIAVVLFLITAGKGFYQAIKTAILNVYWHKQIPGDEDDEEGYCINQENPYYLE